MAMGGRCGSINSPVRSLKSLGPSISTASGRTRSMASRTSFAPAGLWCRTGK